MVKKVSTCLYINKQVLEAAKRVGLNVSRVSENALMRAIERLEDRGPETGLNRPSASEGRGRDSNPGARLHRPVGYQATSPRPLFPHSDYFCGMLIYVF
jgi:post-segregation antitoxin (ccd killing protein)